MGTGMDDSFAFRTTVPIRRRPDPIVVKAAIALGIILLAIGLFARWVMASEERSLHGATARALTPEVTVSEVDVAAVTTPVTISTPTDGDARQALDVAAAAARSAFAKHGTFLDAGPAQLSQIRREYIFVDGPSTMPRVVSVAAEGDVWAAAVLDADGTCFWVRVAANGSTVTGTASECIGRTALRAIPTSVARRPESFPSIVGRNSTDRVCWARSLGQPPSIAARS